MRLYLRSELLKIAKPFHKAKLERAANARPKCVFCSLSAPASMPLTPHACAGLSPSCTCLRTCTR